LEELNVLRNQNITHQNLMNELQNDLSVKMMLNNERQQENDHLKVQLGNL